MTGRRRRGGENTDPSAPPDQSLLLALTRLHQLLSDIQHPRAPEVAGAMDLAERDPQAFWRAINANDWWAGAGSLAAETMADDPGMGAFQWQSIVTEFRERLIEIGQALMERGNHNPGISSWILAFKNWNASGV